MQSERSGIRTVVGALVQQPTTDDQTVRRDIIVIGGSAGSGAPLKRILSELPENFGGSVFVVQHRAAEARDTKLVGSFRLPMSFATDGQRFEPGHVYLAPANRHLMLGGSVMRVLSGPRENMARPSIDVLFRSAAVALGPRVVGVILSGNLDDGVAGLLAIRRCHGVTVVQEPDEALAAELPTLALGTSPTHHLPAASIAALLSTLASEAVSGAHAVPGDLALEARAAFTAMSDPAGLEQLAEPTHWTCQECSGPLWRIPGEHGDHYRCNVGHGYSAASLYRDQSKALERALWIAYRTLIERARLLERLAENDRQRGLESSSSGYTGRLREVEAHAQAVLRALSVTDAPHGLEEEREGSQ